jgi:DNA-binding MarR family transcriptional regulator
MKHLQLLVWREYMKLDDTSERVFAFITAYIASERISPSQREIAHGCSINAATVVRYLDKLEAWGRIRRDPKRSRSIVLCSPDDEWTNAQAK